MRATSTCRRPLFAADRDDCRSRRPTTSTEGSTGACTALPRRWQQDRAGAGAPHPIDPATVKPEDMPTAVRMRRLEQKTQALKERAWQLKARVQMLKEQMLGGGVGAQALIAHAQRDGQLVPADQARSTRSTARRCSRAPTRPPRASTRPRASTSSPARSRRATTTSPRSRRTAATATACSSTCRSTRSPRTATQAFTAGEGKISKVDCKGVREGRPDDAAREAPGDRVQGHAGQPEKPAAAPTPATGATPAPAAAPATTPAPAPAPAGPGK